MRDDDDDDDERDETRPRCFAFVLFVLAAVGRDDRRAGRVVVVMRGRTRRLQRE